MFAYPLTSITATAAVRVITDILCKHIYLATTMFTDLAVLGIEHKHATMKYAQLIGLQKRTLKVAAGEIRKIWHTFLPLAIPNHNKTSHASLVCEPSLVFHGRTLHN